MSQVVRQHGMPPPCLELTPVERHCERLLQKKRAAVYTLLCSMEASRK